MFPRRIWGWPALVATFLSIQIPDSFAETAEQRTAQNLFRRLTGVKLTSSDSRVGQMADLIKKGDVKAAALIATNDVQFLSGTVVPLAAKLGSVETTPLFPFNDFQALFVGVTRDDIDARELMTANYAYQFANVQSRRDRNNNRHFEDYNFNPAKLLPGSLVKVSPQWPDQPERDTAGLLTTRGWAEAMYNTGTNRRAVERSFNMFLCSPIDKWRDFTVSDEFVGRDVDRAPSGDPTTYQTKCRGCHSAMDGMRPAFGHFDFANGRFGYLGDVQIAYKYNQHANVYPQGYAVASDSWTNQTVQGYDQYFGWRGPTEGQGVRDFGTMIANAQAYKTCFARHAYEMICRREVSNAEMPVIGQLADDFEREHYSIKSLFANTAAKTNCF